MNWLKRCLYLQFRILTLTANKKELLSLDRNVLLWGLVMVWIAGLGRYWDAPLEPVFMRSGLPSLIYIFVLGAFLYMFIFLLCPANWSYWRLVTLISMTAPPAFLYAIPFERLYGPDQGAQCNAMVLMVVASWRVLMLGNYLVRTANLNVACVAMAVLLPLMTIVSVLMGMNRLLETVATMGGIRQQRVVMIDKKAEEEAISKFPETEMKDEEKRKARGNVVTRENMDDFYPKVPSYPRLHTYRGRQHIVYLQYREDGQVPPGFKEVDVNDPEYNPMSPILAIVTPLEEFCEQGLAPVFLGFVVAALYGWLFRRKMEELERVSQS